MKYVEVGGAWKAVAGKFNRELIFRVHFCSFHELPYRQNACAPAK